MSLLDWSIVACSIACLIGLSLFIGRRQKNQDEYYLGSRRMPWWLVGFSLMANQASSVSLIGAPAFIALRQGGGLSWLQYELAVPLAMACIAVVLLPSFKRESGYTIYSYLERRFGASVRRSVSAIFLLNRCFGSGVILLATSYVVSQILGLETRITIVIVGATALAYTTIGGLRADIYTDVIQLVILWGSMAACAIVIVTHLDASVAWPAAESSRFTVFRITETGLGDGQTFALWPMVFGGFFLYVSYYGCDQSQAQRLLATSDIRASRAALVLNGVFRFPLVLTYCVVGVLMVPFLDQHTAFATRVSKLPPDLLMPSFFVSFLPQGLLGFVVTGLLMASMSSLDSAMNSLSAATWEDFLAPFVPRFKRLADRQRVILARGITIAWGCAAIVFAIAVEGQSETVIELINRIGSAFYGPVAGTFIAGVCLRRAKSFGVLVGITAGVGANIGLWLFCDTVSWMWWNLIGCGIVIVVAALSGRGKVEKETGSCAMAFDREAMPTAAWLVVWFLIVCALCAVIQFSFA